MLALLLSQEQSANIRLTRRRSALASLPPPSPGISTQTKARPRDLGLTTVIPYQDDRSKRHPDPSTETDPLNHQDASGGRGARSLPGGRSLAPRERSVCAESGERSRPHPAEPLAGASVGRRSRAN